jgi:cytochrome c oxidase assembly protein subunit 15
MSSPVTTAPSRWPHRWAVLLTCATFPLLWWGGLVTATGSGMAFTDWLTSDGVFMPFYPWLSSTGEKFIEHGHRLLGMLAGLLTVALVVSTFMGESRRWVRWFSLVLLGGVILQGVLGGLRVKVDAADPQAARLIALVHGCTGPLFFALTAAMAVVLSRRWSESDGGGLTSEIFSGPEAGRQAWVTRLLRLAFLTAILAYLQLVVGAIVRHSPLMLADGAAALFQTAVYFHVVLAMAVAFHVLLLAHRCFWGRLCRGPAVVLAMLIAMQLLLGLSTWLVKYGMPAWATNVIGETGHFNRASDFVSSAIVTAHGAVGSLIVALAVTAGLRIGRTARVRSLPFVAAPKAVGVVA